MHFVVGVFTQHGTPQEVDAQIERYDETLEVEDYIDMERQEFIESKREYFGGRLASPEYVKFEQGIVVDKYLTNIFNGLKDAFNSSDEVFLEYVKRVEGLCDADFDKEGNRLGHCNPDGKYDWYVIGGRWNNTLNLQDGANASVAPCSHINFRASKERMKRLLQFWEYVVEGKPCDDPDVTQSYGPSRDTLLKIYKNKETYCEAKSLWVPQCFVDFNGEWHEVPDMWGESEGVSPAEIEHREAFFEILTQHPDYHLAIVDCHC